MKVLRKQKCKVGNEGFHIGDQISIELEGLGNFTLTAQAVEEEGSRAWFIFDQPICERTRNGLEEWLCARLKPLFPKKWRNRILDICIPSYEQIFGNGECVNENEATWYKSHIVPTDDEQFWLMKTRANRLRYDENDGLCWWWLRNIYKDSVLYANLNNSEGNIASSTYSACVGGSGYADSSHASNSSCVVPLILICNTNPDRGEICEVKSDEDTNRFLEDFGLTFQNQVDLFSAISQIYTIMEKYGFITMFDLYVASCIGEEKLPRDFRYRQYGWKKGTKISVEITKDGDAILRMSSKPELLV